jgi:hypothetical protein
LIISPGTASDKLSGSAKAAEGWSSHEGAINPAEARPRLFLRNARRDENIYDFNTNSFHQKYF